MVSRIVLVTTCCICCLIAGCAEQTTYQPKPPSSTHEAGTTDSSTKSKQTPPSRKPSIVDKTANDETSTGENRGGETKHSSELTAVPNELLKIFQSLDQLGRGKMSDAQFVELVFDSFSENAWVLDENNEIVTVLRNDLLPWTFRKNSALLVPNSWQPAKVWLKSHSSDPSCILVQSYVSAEFSVVW